MTEYYLVSILCKRRVIVSRIHTKNEISSRLPLYHGILSSLFHLVFYV